jgi:hypothetical protein
VKHRPSRRKSWIALLSKGSLLREIYRLTGACLTAALAAGTVAFLAGCSGNGSSAAFPGGATPLNAGLPAKLDGTGIAPKYLASLRFGFARVQPNGKAPRELAVTEGGTNAGVQVFNSLYKLKSTITKGINGPEGDWYDGNANLYVANSTGVNVTQYNKKEALIFTYSSGLTDPVDVKSDGNGNVYVADYGNGSASVVVEYPQGSNTPTASCATGLANEGVVFDKSGNVFVSGNTPGSTGGGHIVELFGGLPGCNLKTLPVTLGMAGRLFIDKKGDLLAADQLVGVDIIPPPYTKIRSTITGAEDTLGVTLNLSNSLIFITDPSTGHVLVDTYPLGKAVTTISGPLPWSPASNPCMPPPPERNPC